MFKNAFGYRFWSIVILSVGFAHLLSYVSIDLGSTAIAELSRRGYELYHWLVTLGLFLAFSFILRSFIRRLPYLIYLAGGAIFALAFFIKAMGLFFFYNQEDLENSSRLFVLSFSFILPSLIAFLPAALAYINEYGVELPIIRELTKGGEGGSARFAGIRELARHPAKLRQKLFSWPSTEDEGVTSSEGRIFLGRSLLKYDPFPRLIGYLNKSHHVVIASARSGKKLSFLDHLFMTYQSSMIVFDFKSGEHAQNYMRRCSMEFREEKGFSPEGVRKHLKYGRTYIYDPLGKTGTVRYDPITEVDIHSPEVLGIVEPMAKALVLPEGKDNLYFEEMAQLTIVALILYVCFRFEGDPILCFPLILDVFNGQVEGLDFSFEDFLEDMAQFEEVAGGIMAMGAKKLLELGENKTKASILSTVARSLKFLADPVLRKNLTGQSDFSFKGFGNKTVLDGNGRTHEVKETLYFVMPETRVQYFSRFGRLMADIPTTMLCLRDPLPRLDTLIVLEEFPLLGQMKTISDSWSILATFKARYVAVMQSVEQLMQNYPDRYNTMLGNSTVQVFGVLQGDTQTKKWVSNALGQHLRIKKRGLFKKQTISETPRPLLTETEVADKIGQHIAHQICFVAGSPFPMNLERLVAIKPGTYNGTHYRGLGLDSLRGHFTFW